MRQERHSSSVFIQDLNNFLPIILQMHGIRHIK